MNGNLLSMGYVLICRRSVINYTTLFSFSQILSHRNFAIFKKWQSCSFAWFMEPRGGYEKVSLQRIPNSVPMDIFFCWDHNWQMILCILHSIGKGDGWIQRSVLVEIFCILGAVLNLINGLNPAGETECARNRWTGGGGVDLFRRPRTFSCLRTQLNDLEGIGMRFLFVRVLKNWMEWNELNWRRTNRTFHIFCIRGTLHCIYGCQKRAGQNDKVHVSSEWVVFERDCRTERYGYAVWG